MFDLSDPVTLTTNTKNSAGELANAGTMAITVTLPDGTVSSPPAITNTDAGVYQATYLPTMPGLHSVRWVATGTNAVSFSDVFDVRSGSPPYIVSLLDTKQFLNTTGTTDDEELRGYIEAATLVVENIVGPVVARTIVEVQNPGQVIVLNHAPVISLISLISVQPGGPTYNVAELDLDPTTGIIRHPIISSIYFWGPLRVTYVAGRRLIPANHTLAARIIIGHLWETQRAQMGRASRGGRFGTDEISFSPEIGMAVPRRALELLDVDRRRPTMA